MGTSESCISAVNGIQTGRLIFSDGESIKVKFHLNSVECGAAKQLNRRWLDVINILFGLHITTKMLVFLLDLWKRKTLI